MLWGEVGGKDGGTNPVDSVVEKLPLECLHGHDPSHDTCISIIAEGHFAVIAGDVLLADRFMRNCAFGLSCQELTRPP